jgi:protein-S-isoprenylcysteine O-methyltransferase Ste14
MHRPFRTKTLMQISRSGSWYENLIFAKPVLALRRSESLQIVMQLLSAIIIAQVCGLEPLPMRLAASIDPPVTILGIIIGAVAAVLALWPRLVRPTWNEAMKAPDLAANDRLVTSGPYRYVRHPFYLSVLMVAVVDVVVT